MRVQLILLVATTTQAFKSSFINLGGVRHHVRDSGETDGPLAIFFHGFAGSAASFEDVAPLLAAKNVRCIGVDRVAFEVVKVAMRFNDRRVKARYGSAFSLAHGG